MKPVPAVAALKPGHSLVFDEHDPDLLALGDRYADMTPMDRVLRNIVDGTTDYTWERIESDRGPQIKFTRKKR